MGCAESEAVDGPHAKPGRVLFDVTRAALHGGNTGVQRVVRKLLEHGPEALRTLGDAPLVPVVWTGSRYVRFTGTLSTQRHPWVSFLQRVQQRRRLVRLGGDRRAASEPIASESAEWMPVWMERLIGLSQLRRPTVRVEGDDLLVLADAPWNSRTLLDHAARHEARVVVLIHDLLPLQVPETCEAGVPGRFRRWLDRVLAAADSVLTVSQATAEAVKAHAAELGVSGLAVKVFRPGADVTADTNMSAELDVTRLRASLPPCFVGDPTVLCVGTIEPRKDHATLLDAFETYWSRGGEARLLIAGAVGWNADEILRRLDEHPRRGRRLLVFHDLDDHELTYAYRLATAVVCPSLAEGFGLPIVEALRQGSRVIATDIPPHREAGGTMASYFPVRDAAALAGLLQRMDTLPEPAAGEYTEAIDWSQSAAEFFAAALDCAAAR